MWCFAGFTLTLALGVMGCSETSGTGGTAGDRGSGGAGAVGGSAGMGGGGVGGDGGTDLCEGVICDDDGDQCTGEGVCGPIDGMCDYPPVEDGTLCANGICIDGSCGPIGSVFPCTEQGVRAATATGGGPYTFSCDGATTVITEERIDIGNDVILDGEGKLTLDGNAEHRVLFVVEGATVEVHGFTITGGAVGGVANGGVLTLVNCTVSGNTGTGITNAPFGAVSDPVLTVKNSTVSGNGFGVSNLRGTMTLTYTTLSGNRLETPPSGYRDETVSNSRGTVILNYSTVVGAIHARSGTIVSTATIVHGDCHEAGLVPGEWISNGYNVHTGDGGCVFGEDTDRDASPNDLKLGPLQDNGGPTETHALLPGSVAIDVIPEAECVDADGAPLTTDQRGEERPVAIVGPEPKCDVGAFEVQP